MSWLSLICAAALGASTERIDALAWKQPITGDIVSGKVYRVSIPSEVFDGCRAFPADIRIYDEKRNEWPFFLWSPARRDDLIPVFATLGRKTVGTNSTIIAQELVIRTGERAGSPPRHNQVSILTTGNNFIRRVEVLASADGVSWKELGSGFLVDQKRESLVSNRVIEYEETALTRVMLRIHPNATNAKEPIEILDAQIARRVRNAEALQEVQLVQIPLAASDFREGVMTIGYDTGAQNRPLERLRARVPASEEFTLPLKVFGRIDASSSWRWVADGGLYRVGGQSRETVELNGAAFRQLKVEIYHFGQKPPRIESIVADALPQYIVFQSRGGSSPMLHYGAEKMALPHYDLQRRTPDDTVTNLPLVELGKAKSNPLKVANGLSDYLRLMAWFAAAVVGCALLYVLARAVRARL